MAHKNTKTIAAAAVSGGIACSLFGIYKDFTGIWVHAGICALGGGFAGLALALMIQCGRNDPR